MNQTQLEAYARRQANATSNDWSADDIAVDLTDALSEIWVQMKVARGMLEVDDKNATTLPYHDVNLTATTQEYDVSDDGTDDFFTIHKIQVLDENSKWQDVPRIILDEGNQDALSTDETARVPTGYIDAYPFIIFKEIPDTTVSGGIRVWGDRETTGFTSGGTTFVPGIPSIYHKNIAHIAVQTFTKNTEVFNKMERLIMRDQERIDTYEESRRSDEARRLIVQPHNCK